MFFLFNYSLDFNLHIDYYLKKILNALKKQTLDNFAENVMLNVNLVQFQLI